MRPFWLAIGLFFLILLGVSTRTMASGNLTTTQSDQPGQVYVRNQDGTMYLTTQTVPGGTTETTTATTTATTTVGDPADHASPSGRAGRLSLINIPVIAPQGFARDIGVLINAVLSFVMVIAALLVFFYLLWGGIEWITSGGDKGKTERARQKIVAAVIGIIILAASFAVVTLVVRFLGFSSLNDVLDNVQPINPNPPAD